MGKLIVIDGLDGCGKQTQVALVTEQLEKMGYRVRRIEFPKYESLSSGPVRMYLNGEISKQLGELNPYMCSLFYAVDRGIQFFSDFKKDYEDDNCIVIADRYLSANVIYQSSKFNTDTEKEEFFKWLYEIETKYIGIPTEDITIALTLPIEVSQKLMSQRYKGDEGKKDLHEANLDFLKECSKTLDLACNYLPKIGYNWVRMDCSTEDGWVKSREEITNNIMEIILPIIKG